MSKSKALRVKTPALTITVLAERLAVLSRYLNDATGDTDAAGAEQVMLEEMICLRPARDLKEAAIQLALVAGELDQDWSHTSGDEINKEMAKLSRIVASVFHVLAPAGNFHTDELGGWVIPPTAVFPPPPEHVQ